MELMDFSKYVVDNMKRATLSNALNIAGKIGDGGYDFEEFLKSIQSYVEVGLKEGKIPTNKCYAILFICDKYLNRLNSTIRYLKEYLVNDFIIDLWRVFDGN